MSERRVHRLQLRAADEASVTRMLPRLEDALRCASLPGDDARVLLVRRLALGCIAPDISPQALSMLIERQVAQAGTAWAENDPAAVPPPQAEVVCFASPLDARVRLGLRLLRGASCEAWYWPLAVPEFEPGLPFVLQARRVLRTLAAWPQARIAVPAWVAAMVRAGGAATLAAAMNEREGTGLLQQAALPVLEDLDERPAPQDRPSESGPHGVQVPDAPADPLLSLPRWLRSVLQASGGFDAELAPLRSHRSRSESVGATRATVPGGGPEALEATASVDTARAQERAGASPTSPKAELRQATEGPRKSPEASPVVARPTDFPPLATSLHHVLLEQSPYLEPTACGGLLFLLPVLARLGFAGQDPLPADLAQHVLHLALQRLPVDDDDPGWQLARPAPDLESGARALHWLRLARRWLWRAGRLGLRRLVLRPARLGVSATHADLHFTLDDVDLRVRRLGLDIDPGWLPWYGRVVGFHFEGQARP